MKINPKLKKEIEELLSVKQINMNIADMLLSTYPYEDIVTKNIIDSKMKEGLSEKDAYFSALLDYYQIDEDDEESIEIANKYLKENLNACNPKDYLDNPYVKAVRNKSFKNKSYELTSLYYAPYQLFPTDEIIANDYPYEEYYRLGYFKEKFNYLALMKSDVIWMSVNPNEINTMKPFINEANGKVLVLGLGMGYIAYMMSLKEDVKSITVVELDQSIIDIYKNNIYPLLGATKNKIKVVHDDAFRYLENNNKYDYIFADMWHNPEDGLKMYLDLENISKKYNLNIKYWLNPSLIAMKRRCLLTLIEENLIGYSDKDYKFAKNQFDQTINYLYKLNKDVELNTVEDIKKFLA